MPAEARHDSCLRVPPGSQGVASNEGCFWCLALIWSGWPECAFSMGFCRCRAPAETGRTWQPSNRPGQMSCHPWPACRYSGSYSPCCRTLPKCRGSCHPLVRKRYWAVAQRRAPAEGRRQSSGSSAGYGKNLPSLIIRKISRGITAIYCSFATQ